MNSLNAQPVVRLNKYLATAGLGSRRSVEKLIASGQVRVNGKSIKDPAFPIHPRADEILVQGNPVVAEVVPTYILLNKPAGYVTTVRDEKGRSTIYKFIRTPEKVFPVGRLDKDSEGLLLLTNDGELAHRLTHPRYKIEKTYFVLLQRSMNAEQEAKFRQGVRIDRRGVARGRLSFPMPHNRKACLVTIQEGRNRQIRKMFAALKLRVVYLQRIQLGPIQLGKLRPGAWRYLTPKEVQSLKDMVGIANGN